jgi:uncharacterized spore protein YtfJ
MTSEAEARAQAQQTVEGGPGDAFLERFAERIGGRAHVTAVFGEPISRGDLTIVPVARVRWAFGGGAGSGNDPKGEQASGSGGGGGVAADPVGYLEIGPDGATFEPIAGPYPNPAFLLASAIATAIVLRALARLIRG